MSEPGAARPDRWGTLSSALIVAGALFLLVGSVCYWARATLFDASGFSRHAASALLDDDVRPFVASRIVDQLIARGSAELVTVRPLLQATISALLGSESLQPVYESVFRDVHRTVFEREDDTVVLGVSDALIVVTGLLERAYPDLAKRLPSNLQGVFITVSERNYAVHLAQFAEDASVLAYGMLGAALAAFAIAVWLAPSRRTLQRAGLALAVVCVAGVTALDFGGQVLLQAADPTEAKAAAGVWTIFLGGLRAWMWTLGLTGVLLGAVVSSSATADDVSATWQRLRSALGQGTRTAAGRLLHSILFLVFGVALVARPESVVRLGVQIVGLVLLYVGVLGLGNAVRSGDARLVVPLGRVTLRIGTRVLALVTVAVGLVVVAGVALRLLAPSGDEAPLETPSAIERCNGWPELCDRRLNEVAFATTHNSMAAASDPGWYFASHDRGIPEQLEAGVRGFLVDTHYGIVVEEGVRTYFIDAVNRDRLRAELGEEFVAAAQRLSERWTSAGDPESRRPYLCHGFCELGATELVGALSGIRRFLDRNPHEVVILFFEDYVRPSDTAAAFESSTLIDLVYTHQADQPLPTLRQMIERGERVLALSEGKYGEGVRPAWYHAGFELVQDTPYRFRDPEELSCDANRGRPQSPLFLLNHWIEKITPSPADAALMNQLDLLLGRARACQTTRGLFPNLIAINFYGRGDLFRAVDRLNGFGR